MKRDRRIRSSGAPGVVIRNVRKSDLGRALEMEREGFAFYPLGRRQLRYHSNNRSAIFLVAQLDGLIVGDAIGLVRRHRTGASGRVYSLVVDGAYRNMGIGGKLFAATVAELEKRGAHRIYLEVAEKNRRAIRIYERFGFRKTGTLRDYYARGVHAIHMLLDSRSA